MLSSERVLKEHSLRNAVDADKILIIKYFMSRILALFEVAPYKLLNNKNFKKEWVFASILDFLKHGIHIIKYILKTCIELPHY